MAKPAPYHNEDLRQLEHLLPIGFAFLLRFLSWKPALFMAFCAVLYALFVSSRLWKATQRPGEAQMTFSPGKLYYALSVFFLILTFRKDLYIAAAVWANLSVGDAASNLIGRNLGRMKLPWNSEKNLARHRCSSGVVDRCSFPPYNMDAIPSGGDQPEGACARLCIYYISSVFALRIPAVAPG